MPPNDNLTGTQRLLVQHQDRVARYKGLTGQQEHERLVYIVYVQADYDTSQIGAPPPPTIVKIVPSPRVVDRPLETVIQQPESGAVEAVSLQRYFVSDISREYLDDEVAAGNTFYIVAGPEDGEPTPETLDQFARLRMLGSPNRYSNMWRMTLIEASVEKR